VKEHRLRRNTGVLWGMVLLALIYAGLSYFLPDMTDSRLADGAIGVLLGLYICSHPAANAVDLLFFERGVLRRVRSDWALARWLALNFFVFFVGWLVIVSGTTRFTAH
jgi:hypothetical protein